MPETSSRHVLGLATLIGVIVLLDQLFWRPLVVWSDRFKFEQSGAADAPTSRVMELLQGSALIEWMSAHDPGGRSAAGWIAHSDMRPPRRGDSRSLPPTGAVADGSPDGV